MVGSLGGSARFSALVGNSGGCDEETSLLEWDERGWGVDDMDTALVNALGVSAVYMTNYDLRSRCC